MTASSKTTELNVHNITMKPIFQDLKLKCTLYEASIIKIPTVNSRKKS
jgi:hypothetical protein